MNTARMQHTEHQLSMKLENELSRITGEIGALRNGHDIIRRQCLQGRANSLKGHGVKVPNLELDLR